MNEEDEVGNEDRGKNRRKKRRKICISLESAVIEASEDIITESGLIFKVGDSQIVTLQLAAKFRRTRNLDVPRGAAVTMSLQDASAKYGKGWDESLLIVLTEGEFFVFCLDWSYWLPPFDMTVNNLF